MVTEVTLASGTYKQVPSVCLIPFFFFVFFPFPPHFLKMQNANCWFHQKYANLTNMVSIYNRVGKIDETTHGDTRYGTTGRPPPDTHPRFLPQGPPGPPGGPPAPRFYQRPGPGQTPDNSRARRSTRGAAERDDLLDEEEEEADNVQSRFLRHLAAEQHQYQHIAAGSYVGGHAVQYNPHAPSFGYYNEYIMEGVEQNVHDFRPVLRPPPGFEHLAHSRLRRSRSSITVLEDDSDRVKGLLRSRRDSYAQEGFPRMQFQPPTPNMAAAGPAMQNRAVSLEDRPSSTDSGWFPPPIERSPSGMDFHARPSGLLSPDSRFETTREQPLTASSQIWGTADQASGPSRGHSPLEPAINIPGMGGRRLYESASYGPSRISTPSNFAGVPTGPSAGLISRPGGQPRAGSVPRGPRSVSGWW